MASQKPGGKKRNRFLILLVLLMMHNEFEFIVCVQNELVYTRKGFLILTSLLKSNKNKLVTEVLSPELPSSFHLLFSKVAFY